jgi:hypothetical protein
LAKNQDEQCTAEQALRFGAAFLLGGYSLEIDWVHHHQGGNASRQLWGGGRARQKSATMFFKTGKYKSCTLNSKKKTKYRCCRNEIGVETQSGHKRSVIGQKL